MRFVRFVSGLATGIALIGGIGAPAAMASDIGDSTGTLAVVTVVDGGAFDAYFCNSGDGSVSLTTDIQPTAGANGSAHGTVGVCFLDTKSHRAAFDAKLSTSDFQYGGNTIPANNLKVTHTYNVLQIQGDSSGHGDVGDIGYYQDNHDVGQESAGADWTMNNTLESGKTIIFGYAGQGTIGSLGGADVVLTIPAGTQAGTYQSQLTLSIVAGDHP